jgi:hypothetical protein
VGVLRAGPSQPRCSRHPACQPGPPDTRWCAALPPHPLLLSPPSRPGCPWLPASLPARSTAAACPCSLCRGVPSGSPGRGLQLSGPAAADGQQHADYLALHPPPVGPQPRNEQWSELQLHTNSWPAPCERQQRWQRATCPLRRPAPAALAADDARERFGAAASCKFCAGSCTQRLATRQRLQQASRQSVWQRQPARQRHKQQQQRSLF